MGFSNDRPRVFTALRGAFRCRGGTSRAARAVSGLPTGGSGAAPPDMERPVKRKKTPSFPPGGVVQRARSTSRAGAAGPMAPNSVARGPAAPARGNTSRSVRRPPAMRR